jgi:hypothetical protein
MEDGFYLRTSASSADEFQVIREPNRIEPMASWVPPSHADTEGVFMSNGELARTYPHAYDMAGYGAQLMAGTRTTLILDEESRTAAHQLANHYGCPVSDVIRRSLIAQRDSVAGVPKRTRQQRVRILKHLFEIFEGNDASEEVHRLKIEDHGF